mgnify:CR=1 FL=1
MLALMYRKNHLTTINPLFFLLKYLVLSIRLTTNNIITTWFFSAEQENLGPQESLNFNTSYIHNEQDIADIKAEAEAFEAEEAAEVQASEFASAGKQLESEAARNARLEGERQAEALRSGESTGKIEAMQKRESGTDTELKHL